jgi:cytochrome bd-type quinol oxidase subunit 2
MPMLPLTLQVVTLFIGVPLMISIAFAVLYIRASNALMALIRQEFADEWRKTFPYSSRWDSGGPVAFLGSNLELLNIGIR